MATIVVNVPNPTLRVVETSIASGKMTWSAPTLPADATLTGAILSGSWSWSGRGAIQSLTIGGTSASAGVPFSKTLTSAEISSRSLTTNLTGNKNAMASNINTSLKWTNLIVTYTYTVPTSETLYVKQNGSYRAVSTAYKKVGGIWVRQDDITTVFDANAKYFKGETTVEPSMVWITIENYTHNNPSYYQITCDGAPLFKPAVSAAMGVEFEAPIGSRICIYAKYNWRSFSCYGGLTDYSEVVSVEYRGVQATVTGGGGITFTDELT